MGRLTYDDAVSVDLDDRTLAHLQLVIGVKLRRGEPFHFSWNDGRADGGRTTVWVHPQCSLTYRYDGARSPQLNPAWIDALASTANSPAGLRIVPEPARQHASES